jgi:hypothetical protein
VVLTAAYGLTIRHFRVEKERYTAEGASFEQEEGDFRNGFEAALLLRNGRIDCLLTVSSFTADFLLGLAC